MGKRKTPILTKEEQELLNDSILQGVVSRASTLSMTFAIAFSAYSVTSYEFLIRFIPDLTIWQNTWPRLLFNGLPFFLMGLYFSRYQKNYKRKAMIWAIGLPIVFVSACMIHVWPLLWSGKTEAYFFVHAANIFVIAVSLVMTSPPPRILAVMISSFLILFLGPLTMLFLRGGDHHILKVAVGDLLVMLPVAAFGAHTIYKLRIKVAKFDIRLKKLASPFLGTHLTEVIYEQRDDLLVARKVDATVVHMDIRGYTEFYKKTDLALVRQFMAEYHKMVSRYIGQFGGYWHKSVGDAQLASFGAMDLEADLSDVVGIETELEAAKQRKLKDRFNNVLCSVTSIAYHFEELKEQFDVQDTISLGIAIDHGEIQLHVQGHEGYKMELDIDGRAVIRCSRLEAYTKLIRNAVAPTSSVLVVSPVLESCLDLERMFMTWVIDSPEKEVPNFPEINHVLFHVFRNKAERRSRIRRLRTS